MIGLGPFDTGSNDSSCSGCGCDMEVIGPPGPQHRRGCPVKAEEDRFYDESRAAQEREFMGRLNRPIPSPTALELAAHLDSVLFKHHSEGLLDLDDWDEEP